MRFTYATVTAAVALAIVSTVCRAVPVVPYRRNFTPLQFVEHALMHEKAWSLVLRERVRVLPPLPYEDRFQEASALVLGNQQDVDAGYHVRPIVTNVLDEYVYIGSFVDYAANVLHQCLKCFVIKHLVFQSYYIIRLFAMGVNANTIMKELYSLKDNIVVSIDKLTVVPSKLEAIFQLYWEVTWLMQHEVVHHIRLPEYPVNSERKLKGLHKQFENYLANNCTPLMMTRRFFSEINIPLINLMVVDDVLKVIVPEDVFLKLGRAHAMFLGSYLRNLGIETIPRSTWGQIFYYSEKLPIKDELEETNVQIAPPSKGIKPTTTTTTTDET